METDIPFDVEIPERGYVDELKNEEVRELVLGWSVSSNVEQKMSQRQCENCQKHISSRKH